MSDAYERYYREAYAADGGIEYDPSGDPDVDATRYAELRAQTRTWLQDCGLAARPSARVLELGCGLGQLREVHPGWTGLEFSATALERIRERQPDARVLQGDMQQVPLPDASADAIFSWAAIEHVPQPERVLAEVERLLVPGGAALLAPAWNCRAWTVKRLQVRRYRDLRPREILEKAAIPARESLAWRTLVALPRRVRRELAMTVLHRRVPFDYVRLFPDFSLDVPHITDDDAQASMDAHAAMVYFASRGWQVESHPTLRARILSRAEPVVVRKPGATS